MNFYFLDAGIGSVTDLIWLAVILIVGVSIVEWFVLLLFNLGNPGKLFLHSLLVNVVSALLGYALSGPLDSIGQNDSSGLVLWSTLFAITVIVEGFLLQVLNRQQPAKKVWLAALIMNIVTYVALFFLTGHGGR
jgi:O-antigen/teichoic acid export membrane protein